MTFEIAAESKFKLWLTSNYRQMMWQTTNDPWIIDIIDSVQSSVDSINKNLCIFSKASNRFASLNIQLTYFRSWYLFHIIYITVTITAPSVCKRKYIHFSLSFFFRIILSKLNIRFRIKITPHSIESCSFFADAP